MNQWTAFRIEYPKEEEERGYIFMKKGVFRSPNSSIEFIRLHGANKRII